MKKPKKTNVVRYRVARLKGARLRSVTLWEAWRRKQI